MKPTLLGDDDELPEDYAIPGYQMVVVNDFKDVDMREVIRAMPADGKSMIVMGEPSRNAVEVSEFVSGRVH